MLRTFLLLWLTLLVPYFAFAQSYDVEIFANVPGCGNEIIEVPEQCDGNNLGGSSCKLVGFSSGSLSCSSVCTLVTSACVLNPPVTGGTQISFSRDDYDEEVVLSSNLVVTGYSAPLTRVSILKDGVMSATAFADSFGYFQITLSGLTPGDYLLKLVGADNSSASVSTETFVGKVYKDSTTKISGILLPPFSTVSTTDGIFVIGKAVPNSKVIIEWGEKVLEVVADAEGTYRVEVDNQATKYRVGASLNGETAWSPYYDSETRPATACSNTIDLTNDCRVNFVDFAITLWWYLYNSGESKIDFDDNGKLDLVDFSILAYYWTG